MSPLIFLIIEIFILAIIVIVIRQAERTRDYRGSLELNYLLVGMTVLKIILTGVIAYHGLKMCNVAKYLYC